MEQGPHRSTGDGHPEPEEAALGEPVDSLAGTMEVIDFLFLSFRDNYWRRQRHPLQDSCLKNPMDGGAW